MTFRHSVPSPSEFTPKRFHAFMVELFAAGFFDRTPRLVKPDCIRHRMQTPTEARLNEPSLAAIPLDGIQLCSSLLQNLTRFGRNGLTEKRSHSAIVSAARYFSVARLQPHHRHGIELTDCSFQLGKGLVVRASSNWTSHSHGIQLYG